MAALTPVRLRPDMLIGMHEAYPERYPILLQSAAHGSLSRFDILFACPREHLTLHGDNRLTTDATIPTGTSFLATLDAWFAREAKPSDASLPFTGGWFLFLGYELAAQIETSLRLPTYRGVVAHARRIPAAIVVRHEDQSAWIVDEDGSCTATIAQDIERGIDVRSKDASLLAGELLEDDSDRYCHTVREALAHIAAGDIYQANLSRAWRGRLRDDVDVAHVYRRLRAANPAPFAASARLPDRTVISSSPERLIEVRDGIVSTRPIAGTRPRVDRNEDAEKLRELQTSPKERAEHVMLIDLERNDLGRICAAGSVAVDEFMTLESYAHVHHIVSNVRGHLCAGVTPGQAIAAVFPGGTITGCPKVRCMQIIADLEQAPRGAYTGSLGYLNQSGSMDLNILIRTLEIRDGAVTFRAGAGIVADSIAERELEETRAKARGLINALSDARS